ncbi:MAG: hypothetical protein OEZ68_14225 [Gammaproteobacteria bacterium]|nr:hypothetical protein [Gammaproteobacteria bacterium]MDH5801960.1 hypothetical protein [Gammaproteobacteria bacterium]
MEMSVHQSLQYAKENNLGRDVQDKLEQYVKKYDGRSLNPINPGVGDLSEMELIQIQNFVNKYFVDLVVVGSALYGKRLNPKGRGPVGHTGRSDIDYINPNIHASELYSSKTRAGQRPQDSLPCLDPMQQVFQETPNTYMHRLWFSPLRPRRLLLPGDPNPTVTPVNLTLLMTWVGYERKNARALYNANK